MNRISRAYAILLLALVILSSIAPVGNYDGNEKKYLPKTFKKLRFGMSLEAVKKQRGKLTDISEEGYAFRKVFAKTNMAIIITSIINLAPKFGR